MNKISCFAVGLAVLVFFAGGCKLLDELNPPAKKPQKAKPAGKAAACEPAILPDGTTIGLNKYEMEYLKDIDQDFKRQQRENSRKVFGGLDLRR
ncbi:MAG: hypothetical protein PHV59_01795 [Victivallales bacterium]|nr:hypothetical protein [Victivallales bacterium]